MFPNLWERSHFSTQKTAGKPLCKSPTSRFRTPFLYHKTPICKSQYIIFLLPIFWWHFQIFNSFFYKFDLIRGFYGCCSELSYFRRHSLHALDDQTNRVVVIESSLLFFVLFIYFPTIWWSGGGTSCAGGTSKLYLTILLVQATIPTPRFLLEKKDRLRLIRRSRGFDQYADQYQKISGWTQWTRQLFVPTETGGKSAGGAVKSWTCWQKQKFRRSPQRSRQNSKFGDGKRWHLPFF